MTRIKDNLKNLRTEDFFPELAVEKENFQPRITRIKDNLKNLRKSSTNCSLSLRRAFVSFKRIWRFAMRRWGLRLMLAIGTGIGIGAVDLIREPLQVALKARFSSAQSPKANIEHEPARVADAMSRKRSQAASPVPSFCPGAKGSGGCAASR
jgi:hypothetical protein